MDEAELQRALEGQDEAGLEDMARRLARSEEDRRSFRTLMGRRPELALSASARWEEAVSRAEGMRTAALVARILRNGIVGDTEAQNCCL